MPPGSHALIFNSEQQLIANVPRFFGAVLVLVLSTTITTLLLPESIQHLLLAGCKPAVGRVLRCRSTNVEHASPSCRAALETPGAGGAGAVGVPGTARAARPGEMLVSQTGEGRLRQLLSEGGLPGWHGGHGCVMLQGEHVHIQAGIVVRPSVPRHEGLQQRQRYLRCLARTGWLELALILAFSALSLKPEIHRIFSEHLGLRTAVGMGQVIGPRPDQTLPASPV